MVAIRPSHDRMNAAARDILAALGRGRGQGADAALAELIIRTADGRALSVFHPADGLQAGDHVVVERGAKTRAVRLLAVR